MTRITYRSPDFQENQPDAIERCFDGLARETCDQLAAAGYTITGVEVEDWRTSLARMENNPDCL